jgi:acetylornithine deacetylase/succinyl-diaminopimelate desuccinylase-like protein
VEGEEEIGSPSLAPFLNEHRDMLAADIIAISDSPQYGPEFPAIVYGLRGLTYVEFHVQAARGDLHSGLFGGGVANAVNVLATALGKLIDDDGHVTIPGFYDDVLPLEDWERDNYAAIPFDGKAFFASIGAKGPHGEAGYSTLERITARPTLDVNGIWGGYQGEGSKTIVPAEAGAKVSMRLVPNQDPHRIAEAIHKHVVDLLPDSVDCTVTEHAHAEPVLVPAHSDFMKAAQRAIAAGFGRDPLLLRGGGSIPIVSDFKRILELDTLLVGFGQPDDALHSPNERFRLVDFHHGCLAAAHLLDELASKD